MLAARTLRQEAEEAARRRRYRRPPPHHRSSPRSRGWTVRRHPVRPVTATARICGCLSLRSTRSMRSINWAAPTGVNMRPIMSLGPASRVRCRVHRLGSRLSGCWFGFRRNRAGFATRSRFQRTRAVNSVKGIGQRISAISGVVVAGVASVHFPVPGLCGHTQLPYERRVHDRSFRSAGT